MKNKFTIEEVITALALVFQIAATAAVAWVVVHFLKKFW